MKAVMLKTLALALLLPLAACSQADHAASQPAASATTAPLASAATGAAPTSWVGRQVADAMQEARRELATKNIDVADGIHIGRHVHVSGKQSRAQITPQGDLLIDGKPVAATPQQHQLLLDYRQRLITIAEAGMAIGTEGADLGMQAASAALRGVFSGKSGDEVEAAIKPQADRIQAAAVELCRRLPDLHAAQQQLAAAMPAFQPYATMTQRDVEECGKDKHGKGSAAFSD